MIEVDQLTKHFGSKTAVDDLSFKVDKALHEEIQRIIVCFIIVCYRWKGNLFTIKRISNGTCRL